MANRPAGSDSLLSRIAYVMGCAVRYAVQAAAGPVRAIAHKMARGSRSETPAPRCLPPRPAVARRLPFEAARAAAEDGCKQLSKVLVDPDPAVRRLALETVAELEEERAAALIVDLLHDADPGVRCAAAATAGRIHADGAMFSLILALDDAAPEVQQEAKLAIELITGEPLDLPSHEARQERLDELKQQWKEQRLAQLAAKLQVEGR